LLPVVALHLQSSHASAVASPDDPIISRGSGFQQVQQQQRLKMLLQVVCTYTSGSCIHPHICGERAAATARTAAATTAATAAAEQTVWSPLNVQGNTSSINTNQRELGLDKRKCSHQLELRLEEKPARSKCCYPTHQAGNSDHTVRS